MIAGKTHSEILLMTCKKRCRWYKRISFEEKEEAMKVVEEVRRIKICEWWTPERKTRRRDSMAGKNSPRYGKTHTEEAKAKISASWTSERKDKASEIMTGENNPAKRPTVRAKMRAWHTDKTLTDEHKAKISAATRGENNPFFGKTHTNEANDKNRVAHIDKIASEETKAKMSEAHIELWKDPEFRTNRSGENHHNWQGGISTLPYGPEFNDHLKRQIRERDNYTCQECQHTEEQLGYNLSIHHIDYDKENNSPENLITLCRSCHSQTNFGREDWTEYFSKITEAQL